MSDLKCFKTFVSDYISICFIKFDRDNKLNLVCHFNLTKMNNKELLEQQKTPINDTDLAL